MRKGARTASGKIRWRCAETSGDRTLCYQTTNPKAAYRGRTGPIEKEEPARFDLAVGKSQTFLVTWAQNATPHHKGFLSAAQTYCRENKAILCIQPGRYKNPTSRWEDSQVNAQWWDAALVPYLNNARKLLNRNLMWLADVPVQATSPNPLGGLEGMSHGESSIVGHPRLQMNCIATPHQKLPKIMTTTGAITRANYTDTPTGKKAEFHHVIGAVVVELSANGKFHLRHINARPDGAFCDLDRAYYPEGSSKPAGPYLGLVTGDTHVRFTDKSVTRATYGKKSLIELLDPRTVVVHDLLDAYAVNPHHEGKPFINYTKWAAGYGDIKDEVVDTVRWLQKQVAGRQARIIASNHNDFLARWLDRTDWRREPENAEFYLETALYMVRASKMEDFGASVPDPFQYWVEQLTETTPNIRCVRRSEKLIIGGIDCSHHGDQGSSGSRGSRKNISRIGVRTIIGHGHSPGIEGGCSQTGTSTPLRLEYTGSIGAWLQSHIGVNPFGKRQIYILIDGKFWRGQKR